MRRGARGSGPLVTAATLLGAGMGGFVDGIVLHQILQWHNMLSSRVPPTDLTSMKYNMVFDGLFHAGTWLVTLLGLVLLFRAGQRGVAFVARTFAGGLILGWGLFNLVEGLIDHQLLGVHHVRPGPGQLAWDLGFLALGLLMAIAGAWLIRSDQRTRRSAPEIRVADPAEVH